MKCAVEVCPKEATRRGWCRGHHSRWERHGDPGNTILHEYARQGCSVEGCSAKHRMLGFCAAHAWRLRRQGAVDIRYGHKVAQVISNDDLLGRLMSRISDASDPNACWIWAGTRGNHGYGVFSSDNSTVQNLAHRMSYELLVGPIPENLTIDHLCRNTLCVNPNHLEPVTQAENTRRAFAARKQEKANA